MIYDIYPGSALEVNTAVVPLSAKVSGWTPSRVEFHIGSGRVPIVASYNGATGSWEADFDTTVPINGGTGLFPTPVWNFAACLTVIATGSRAETSTPHWFFVISHNDTPVTSFGYRSALNFSLPPYAGTITQFRNHYINNGTGAYGESMTTLVADPIVAGRYAAQFRPDPAGDLADQPTSSGLRCQFQSPATIQPGDDFYVSTSYYFPDDFPIVENQNEHVNLFQFFGPDTYGTEWNSFGASFVLNINPATRADGSYYISEKDVLKSGGNSQNPGLLRPFIYHRFTRNKWYDIVLRFRVSTDPRLGFLQAWINDGSGLVPVTYPIPYPGTNDLTKIPFVAMTPWHSPQRTDVQAYGNRDSIKFPLRVLNTGHKQGSTLESVNPGSYVTSSSLPGFYQIASLSTKLPDGRVAAIL